MYISNVQWRGGGVLGDLHDAFWVAWGCYRGCPDCTIARCSGWVALSILRDKHSSGARECGLAVLLQAAVPDGLSLSHLHWNIFLYDFILIYLNSCVIHVYQCTNPVDLSWRTGGRRSDATSVGLTPARLWCAPTRPLGYGSKWWNIVNCTGYMVFLASLHVGGGVCASGKLALADISTRSTSGPLFCWAGGCPPRDFVGSRGCEIQALNFLQLLWDWRGSAELPVRFRGDTINIHAWSRGSRDPRNMAVGFLAAVDGGPK